MLKLVLENVRCFVRLELPLDAPVTVIIGENGSGKTTVAEALASLASGEGEGLSEFPLRDDARDGRIALEGQAEWSCVKTPGRRLDGARRRLPSERWLLAYGRYRRVWMPPEAFRTEREAAVLPAERALRVPVRERYRASLEGRRTLTLRVPDGELMREVEDLLLFVDELRERDERMRAVWARLTACVEGLEHGLTGLARAEVDGRDEIRVSRQGISRPLRELSDGFQAVLVVVLDLALRLGLLPPETGIADGPLVVVDEIDLHLHPRWQRTVVAQLTRLFPEVCWLFTTHSGAVVQGAIDAGFPVYVLAEGAARRLGESTTRDLDGAEIGSILHDKRTFAAGSRYSRVREDEEREIARLRACIEGGRDTPEDRANLRRMLDAATRRLTREDKRRGGDGVLVELAKSQLAMLKRLERELAGAGR
jgi:energy-coupling factor transporter ATP-binding protein EcfA2